MPPLWKTNLCNRLFSLFFFSWLFQKFPVRIHSFFLLVGGWARRTMLIWYVMIPNKKYLSKMPRSNKPWGMYVHLNQIISFSMPLAGNSRSLRYLSLHALISYLFMIFFLGQIFLWSWIPNESPITWLIRSLPLLKGGSKKFRDCKAFDVSTFLSESWSKLWRTFLRKF